MMNGQLRRICISLFSELQTAFERKGPGIGQGQPGRFNVYLQDPDKKQTKVGSAGTADGGEISSVALGKKPSDLNNWWICFDITVMSPTGGDGESYLVVTTIRQDGSSLVSVQQADAFSGSSQSLLVYVRCQ